MTRADHISNASEHGTNHRRPGTMKSILVIQLARFGDLLQSTPLFVRLKEALPGCRLTVLADSGPSATASRLSRIDEVLTMDIRALKAVADDMEMTPDQKISHARRLMGPVAARRFDAVINLNTSRISALAGALTASAIHYGPATTNGRDLTAAPWSPVILGLMTRRRFNRFNLVDLYASYAEKIAGADMTRPVLPVYDVQPPSLRWAETLLTGPGGKPEGPVIAFQPGCRHPARQWPAEHFALLARSLITRLNARIILLGLPSEKSLGAEITETLRQIEPAKGGRVTDLTGRTSEEELAGIISRADLLVCPDTGAMHLAAAVGTPVAALFMGPAFCHETGPYGRNHVVLQTVGSCAPCFEHAIGCGDYRCRGLISPDMVFKTIAWRLNRLPGPPPPNDLGPDARLLVSDMDDFGLFFTPAEGHRPDAEDALALVYRESGRAFIRPSYQPGQCWSGRESAPFGDLPDDSVDRLAGILAQVENLEKNFNSGHWKNGDHTGRGEGLAPLTAILRRIESAAGQAAASAFLNRMSGLLKMATRPQTGGSAGMKKVAASTGSSWQR